MNEYFLIGADFENYSCAMQRVFFYHFNENYGRIKYLAGIFSK